MKNFYTKKIRNQGVFSAHNLYKIELNPTLNWSSLSMLRISLRSKNCADTSRCATYIGLEIPLTVTDLCLSFCVNYVRHRHKIC